MWDHELRGSDNDQQRDQGIRVLKNNTKVFKLVLGRLIRLEVWNNSMWVVVIIHCYCIYQFKTIHIYYLIAPVGGESLGWSIVEWPGLRVSHETKVLARARVSSEAQNREGINSRLSWLLTGFRSLRAVGVRAHSSWLFVETALGSLPHELLQHGSLNHQSARENLLLDGSYCCM